MSLTALTPMLGVKDVQRSLDFYRTALGFKEHGRFEHEGTLCWAHVCDGHIDLMFTRECAAKPDPATRKDTILYFYPDDVAALHAELRKGGFDVSDLRVTFYKMKEFELADPDGYQLWFGQDTHEQPYGCS